VNVRITTNISPPISFDPAAPRARRSLNPLLALIRPTVHVSGLPVVGETTYAPYGEATEGAGAAGLAVLVGLATIGFFTLIKIVVRR